MAQALHDDDDWPVYNLVMTTGQRSDCWYNSG